MRVILIFLWLIEANSLESQVFFFSAPLSTTLHLRKNVGNSLRDTMLQAPRNSSVKRKAATDASGATCAPISTASAD